jgi:hypothetical protein
MAADMASLSGGHFDESQFACSDAFPPQDGHFGGVPRGTRAFGFISRRSVVQVHVQAPPSADTTMPKQRRRQSRTTLTDASPRSYVELIQEAVGGKSGIQKSIEHAVKMARATPRPRPAELRSWRAMAARLRIAGYDVPKV